MYEKPLNNMNPCVGFLSHWDFNLYKFRLPIMLSLIERGYKVYAICPKGDMNKLLESHGVAIVNYEINRQSLNPFVERKAIDNIYQAIKHLDLSIIHTFGAKPNIYGTFAARRAKVPVILNLVEGLGSFYTSNTLKVKLVRWVMERLYTKIFKISDGCVFVNTSDPQYMIDSNIIDTKKVNIIKSVGIDTKKNNIACYNLSKLENIRSNLNVKNKLVVLMVARAIKDKGVREFYEAASIIANKQKDVEFILIGGIDEGNHTNINKDFLLQGCVKWLDHRDDVIDIMAISDICVLPSYREGLPVTLLEACAMSKPIVATNAYGCRDVVTDTVNGFLVPIKNAQLLSEKIETLLSDKSLRMSMGAKGRELAVSEFDINIVNNKYMQYYDSFLKKL
jgi:N,N'-diacetylbacillosaminyl-diphospho-undecaprenol alpha-1,3-N-acetylgalactosaminyltransferase